MSGIRLAELQGGRRTTTVTYGGQEIEVIFNPGKVTPDLIEKVFVKTGNTVTTIVDVLSDLLVEFDVTDEEGKRLAPTRELLNKLPLPFLNTMLKTVTRDLPVGEA